MKKLIVLATVLVAAGQAWARGGGGCLREGTPILTPAGPVPIERLTPGDPVWTVADGRLQPGRVLTRLEVQPESYVRLSVAGRTLWATPEHPFQVAPGVFREAGQLRSGDRLWSGQDRQLHQVRLDAVARVHDGRPAYNLLVSAGGTFLADGVVVHNKGCFLPDTPILRADGTPTPIRLVRPGEQVLAFTSGGQTVTARVQAVWTHEVDEYAIVTTEQRVLRVTPEHPFYVGHGTFRTLESLAAGASVYAYDGTGLRPQRIVRIERVHARTRVYNLQTDAPHTFFADGIAVHNKGGGCFPAGTPIETPAGPLPIEALTVGTQIVAVAPDGRTTLAAVEATLATTAELVQVETDAGTLATTRDHPLCRVDGRFTPAGELERGSRIVRYTGGRAEHVTVRRVSATGRLATVYNLRAGWPHTYLADGWVVHNKGGGGGFGGGGWHGSSGHSSGRSGGSGSSITPADTRRALAAGMGGSVIGLIGWPIFGDRRRIAGYIICAIVGFLCGFMLVFLFPASIWIGILLLTQLPKLTLNKKEEDLDFVHNPAAVARKAAKTRKLLEFVARQDPTMAPDVLTEQARRTFVQLQQCWEARDYGPMQPLLMPDLYGQHTAEIQGLIHNHEINRIEGLQVDSVEVVGVRYTDDPNAREFTALITARARDYYVDDRTGEFLRGDDAPARFQEFWTFHRHGDAWLLREIEQSRESDVLAEENFVEMFTEDQVQNIYRDAAGAGGPAGPWLEKEVETKATRISRMLNFLEQTDPLWNQQLMKERARQVFTDVYLAQESGDPQRVNDQDLFPAVASHLREEMQTRREKGVSVEYRNLCIRKVELILVRNYDNPADDEYTVRISAHAQKIVHRHGAVASRDKYVSPFEEYWTFGRQEGRWKLKEVLPPARGRAYVSAENIDQGASPGQLQWYYRHPRAG